MSGITERLAVTLPISTEAPSIARHQLRRSLPALGRRPRAEDAELLISELVTNCVRHAAILGDRPIVLVADVREMQLRVEVIDAGRGFAPLVSTGVDGEGTSGWGLLLVEQLADEWGVSRSEAGETMVWFEMDLG
jgi:anti-sigma regulatory factor (Ser/Thr protein kinase)